MNNKILIVTECFYPEEFKINDIAVSWREKGNNIDVLTLFPTYPVGKVYDGYKNRLFYKDYFCGVSVYRIYAVTGYRNSLIKKIIKYINFMVIGSIFSVFIGRKYDYVFGYNMSALTNMLPAVIVSKLYNKPLLLWVQDVWPESVYAYGFKKTKIVCSFLDKFVTFIYSNATSIAVSGKGFTEKLKPFVGKNIVYNYLPNWADHLNMDMSPVVLSEQKKNHFSFAGNIGKVQNLEIIIKSFMMIPEEYQAISQLNIIGDGSNIDALRLIARNASNIIFHGKQNRNLMSGFYKASDFLIISLIDEPIFSVTVPAKTQTYISAKKPILGIINGDTADIIKDNSLGICADPSNIDEITSLFCRCIEMTEEERCSYTKNNDELLSTTFNKERIIDEMLSILIAEKKTDNTVAC